MSANVTVDGNAKVHPAAERPRRAPKVASRCCDDSSLDSASWSSGASSNSSLGLRAARRGTVKARLGCRRNQNGVKSRRVAPDGVPAAVRASPPEKSRCGWMTANTGTDTDMKVDSNLKSCGELFAGFDAAFVSKFSQRKITSLKTVNNVMLSELKLRSIVENAKQILKVVDEFGSVNNYCWSFVNHKPINNRFRYQRTSEIS